MRLILLIQACSAMIMYYQNGTTLCDGTEITLPNTTFCTPYGLGTKYWVYNTSHFIYSEFEILAYHQTVTGEQFIVTKNLTDYYINDVLIPTLTRVVPGYLVFDSVRNTLFLYGISSQTVQTLSFLEFNRSYSLLSAYLPSSQTTTLELYLDNSTAMVLAMKDGAYYIYKATAGSRRLLLNSTDSIAIFDRTEMNITIIPKVDGVVSYCNINCSGWIDPNISESYQYATSHELTTVETSTPSTTSLFDSTEYISSLLMYVSTLVTSYASPSYSSSIYRTSSPEIFITIWSSQEIHKLSLNPLHITGQLVIPNQTRLRLDVSDFDISAGESIVLFTFSSRQGSFDELELIGYSECLGVSAHLEESETQITLVFTTTSVVCRATLKQIM